MRQPTEARLLTDGQQPHQRQPLTQQYCQPARHQHQTTTSLLLNLEAAVYSLAGQVQRAEEVRSDVTEQLVDTLCAFHEDRQPADTSDKATQTHVTTPRPTVTADRAMQVSGRACHSHHMAPTLPPLHPPLLPPSLSPSHPPISLRKTDEIYQQSGRLTRVRPPLQAHWQSANTKWTAARPPAPPVRTAAQTST